MSAFARLAKLPSCTAHAVCRDMGDGAADSTPAAVTVTVSAAVADSLITNLHLPKTSLLIMVCAFAGYDLAMEAYRRAIKDKYRFFSYGDAMLVI